MEATNNTLQSRREREGEREREREKERERERGTKREENGTSLLNQWNVITTEGAGKLV